jgi:hypothetical protein
MLHSRDWAESSDAWVISQSLALSLEIAQTGYIDSVHHAGPAGMLLDVLFTRSDFGYTIGSPGAALKALSTLQRVDGVKNVHGLGLNNLEVEISEALQTFNSMQEGRHGACINTSQRAFTDG